MDFVLNAISLHFPSSSTIILVLQLMEEQIMPRKITDACIACGTCASSCPVECIAEGDIYVIDPDQCIDCGACQENCPVEAIVEE